MTKAVAHLPADAARLLQEFKSTSRNHFYSYLIALREKGWPLRAIAEPLSVSRAAVLSWEKEAREMTITDLSHSYPIPELPMDSHAQPYYPKKITPDIPKKDRPKLIQLHRQAKKVTRWTPTDHPDRLAAKELEDRILFYANQRKVPVASIAKHLGVTRRAIAQRIEKHD